MTLSAYPHSICQLYLEVYYSNSLRYTKYSIDPHGGVKT